MEILGKNIEQNNTLVEFQIVYKILLQLTLVKAELGYFPISNNSIESISAEETSNFGVELLSSWIFDDELNEYISGLTLTQKQTFVELNLLTFEALLKYLRNNPIMPSIGKTKEESIQELIQTITNELWQAFSNPNYYRQIRLA